MTLPVRKKNRKEWYDYSAWWWYFLTLCTENRFHFFGEIVDDEMVLSDAGKIAHDSWINISGFYDSHVDIHDFVIMQNHIHGIVVIDGNSVSISTIIKSYKWYCSKSIRQFLAEFARQKSFHDRIIRDQKEYENISHYIKKNPESRKQDKRYS